MTNKHNQDIENRLKNLKGEELADLLDFVLPNRLTALGDHNVTGAKQSGNSLPND